MNTPSAFCLSGYALGFVSGLVVTWTPFLAVWDGSPSALVCVAVVSAAAAHAAGNLGSR